MIIIIVVVIKFNKREQQQKLIGQLIKHITISQKNQHKKQEVIKPTCYEICIDSHQLLQYPIVKYILP